MLSLLMSDVATAQDASFMFTSCAKLGMGRIRLDDSDESYEPQSRSCDSCLP